MKYVCITPGSQHFDQWPHSAEYSYSVRKTETPQPYSGFLPDIFAVGLVAELRRAGDEILSFTPLGVFLLRRTVRQIHYRCTYCSCNVSSPRSPVSCVGRLRLLIFRFPSKPCALHQVGQSLYVCISSYPLARGLRRTEKTRVGLLRGQHATGCDFHR